MSVRAFFEGLESRSGSPKLDGIDESYRFEIAGEGTWHVAVAAGKVTVTEDGNARADATIRTSGETFDRIVAGDQNPAMAYMSGKVKVDGDLGAVMKLQKLF
ncbi:MAG TPA: SCP2 sterol-binding domain-containing protein [Gaiellaceae bacterium]|jgi:putative sterol carrier protein